MASITLAQINNAIADTLGAATGLGANHHQSYNELTEGMADLPQLQVYWEEDTTNATGATGRLTGRNTNVLGVIVTEHVFHADLYARQRSQLGEDMTALYTYYDAVRDVLEAQTEPNYFGLAGIKTFRWTTKRVVFSYANVEYVGCRFTITVRVF